MELIKVLIDFVLHIDEHLKVIIAQYGVLTHLILFVVIFCETGLVITPFLPGDSLLFAAGTFAALGSLHLEWLLILLFIAAVAGDTLNYWIGHWIGPKAFSGSVPFLKQSHLDRTNAFFAKHGGKTIILARFVPIVRTFAPFVAGIGAMNYGKFILYNLIGGFLWVCGFTLLGYFFGTLEIVQKNFELVMIAIVLISLVPAVWESLAPRLRGRGHSVSVGD
ncbi:MAG: DedA family protein [Caldilineaceae bacterium]